ncbi:MAG: DNA adenine methylase [Magnetococcales bacterium]|nr:DNA adenine methylase [Magnetococcales bacterium]
MQNKDVCIFGGAVKSPLTGWLGGKYKLAKTIVARLPEHHCYVEPFAGGAQVLFRKEPSTVEVINDINRDLITLYRVLQHHLEEFLRWFKWALASRDEFKRLLRLESDALTDIQRACRFYYIQRNSFGGRIGGKPSFGYATTRPPKLNLLRIEEELSAAHLRLARCYIECLPYTDVIKRYDRPQTLFYIDPPYWDCEEHYGKGIFSKADFNNLAEILSKTEGKFLMSLNDTPGVREVFSGFEIHEVQTQYSVSKAGNKQANEVLISNYPQLP